MNLDEQRTRAELFRSLHVPGRPLVLFNIWDAGSARVVAEAGAPALATGSWSVAQAHGHDDGEALPLDLAIASLARITASTSLPVTVDLERGYGDDAAAVGRTVARAIDVGAVGCNLEDGTPEGLRTTHEQSRRLATAKAAGDEVGLPFFINARTDVFLNAPADAHAGLVDEALDRGRAYANAGADGLFVPGLIDPALIAEISSGSALPVNVMVASTSPPLADLARLGVARVSHGPGPYRAAMELLRRLAHDALEPVG